MSYKRRVLTEGLLLVLVPLLLGAGTICTLAVLRAETLKLAAEERKEAQLLSYMNIVFIDYGLLMQIFVERMLGLHGAGFGLPLVATVQQSINKASLVAPDNANITAALASISELLRLESGILADPRINDAENRELNALMVSRQSPRLILKMYNRAVDAQQRFEQEWVEWRALGDRQIDLERKIRQVVLVAIVVNVVLSCLLVLKLIFPFVKRIRLLMSNVRKLYKSEKVERCLSGNDELAYLDETICAASKALSDFAEHRERILRMVAHDLRSPLMSAQCNLELIPEFTDDLPDDSVLELQRTYKLMDAIVTRAQDMLNRDAQNENAKNENAKNDNAKNENVENFGDFSRGHLLSEAKPGLVERIKALLLAPNLLQQRLILVLVLLILQTLPLLAINQQILKVENGCAEEMRNIDLSMRYTMFSLDLQNALLSKFDSLMRSNKKQKENSLSWVAQAEHDFDELAANYPDEIIPFTNAAGKDTGDAAKLKTKFFDALKKFGEGDASSVPNAAPQIFAPGEASRMRHSHRSQLESMYRLESIQKEQDYVSEGIEKLILGTLAADLILALLMVFLFSLRTEHRLQRIMQSVTALSEGEPLQPGVAGTDEIAELDNAIHFADQELRRASAERSQMMNILSDSMRVPLHEVLLGLDNFTGYAKHQLSDRSRGYIVKVRGSVEQVLALLDDLLTVESAEIGRLDLSLASWNAAEIVDIACGAVSGLAAKKQCKIVDNSEAIQLTVDKSRAVQVLVNFISNAIKFSPEKTTVTVTVSRAGSSTRFSVTDNGLGMDEATRSRVFEERFRGLNVQKGSGFGLGLAICKLIVESHGGTIGVDSELGKGSTFWFEIPSSG